MKKAPFYRILLLLFIIMPIVRFQYQVLGESDKLSQSAPEFLSNDEKDLYAFILNNLGSGNGCIRTNCLAIPPRGDFPAGSDILSESLGLMLEYSLEADNAELFEQQFQLLEKSFISDTGGISWKISADQKNRANTNATIDDLRICGALLSGYEKWGRDQYLQRALAISRNLKACNVKNGVLVDYYDRDSR
jgi:hypothetical protein